MNNRMPWLKIDDYVIVDSEWFREKQYRLRKSLNDIVIDDACTSMLRIVYVSPQGQSVKLKKTYETQQKWTREHPLMLQIAHHADVYPMTFSSRHVSRGEFITQRGV